MTVHMINNKLTKTTIDFFTQLDTIKTEGSIIFSDGAASNYKGKDNLRHGRYNYMRLCLGSGHGKNGADVGTGMASQAVRNAVAFVTFIF